MTKFEVCIPTPNKFVRAGADWFHEVKYDGYRFRIERDGKSVRLITRGGHDWTKRFPWIVEAALKNWRSHFVIDGEAVILCLDGIADFNALHSGRHNSEVQFCAFDVLALDDEDLRVPPLSMRKANLERLLRGRPDGIFSSIPLRLAPSVLIYFGPPASWAWKVWFRSGATANIGAAGRLIGSRSRTERILQLVE
jgi:bifunctional non-homologous end joining protein LigD